LTFGSSLCASLLKEGILSASPRTSPWLFFLLVFLLSAPVWLIGSVAGAFPLPIDLPFAALMTFNPMIAALVLIYGESGRAGVKSLLARAVDVRRIRQPIWYFVAIFLMPLVLILAYWVLRSTEAPLPEPKIPLQAIPPFFLMFFIGAIGEELGWQGFVFDRLRERWNALEASLILGVVWALWHVIPMAQTNHGAAWVFWQCMTQVVSRIITVWLYAAAGESVFITILFHAMTNVSEFLFPNYGSHYDPFVTFIILLLTAAIIIFLWGAATLARFRYTRLSAR
jgi:membrane protease YdiL (CAAX protease family)